MCRRLGVSRHNVVVVPPDRGVVVAVEQDTQIALARSDAGVVPVDKVQVASGVHEDISSVWFSVRDHPRLVGGREPIAELLEVPEQRLDPIRGTCEQGAGGLPVRSFGPGGVEGSSSCRMGVAS